MIVLAAGDLHYGLKVGGIDVNKCINDAFQVVLDATRKADLFVILGDVFHKCKPSPVEYAVFIDRLKEIGCPTVVINGNHDVGDGFDAYEPLKKMLFPHEVHFVSVPSVINFEGRRFFFMPYLNDATADRYASKAQDMIDEAMDWDKGNVAAMFCHLDVEGDFGLDSPFMQGSRLTFDMDEVKKFPFKVFCGHYHRYKRAGNVYFVGSVVPTEFSSDDQEQYYVSAEV